MPMRAADGDFASMGGFGALLLVTGALWQLLAARAP